MVSKTEEVVMEKLGIIGLGKIGEALISGIQKSSLHGQYSLAGTTRSPESADLIAKKHNISVGVSNSELVKKSSILILAVKPQQAQKVLEEITPQLNSKHLLISLCAAVTVKNLLDWTKKKCTVVRAMPNTPCLIGEGMTVLTADASVPEKAMERASAIFSTVGKTAVLEESLMDGVTGLSGCGPAYMFLVLEALSDAGVKVGINRKLSTLLAAQTMLGAAKMAMERGDHPASMKDEVTTPAGCTIDGLMALEQGKLRVALIQAVMAATSRSKKLQVE